VGAPFDSLKNLGYALIEHHASATEHCLMLFKSDVAEAHCLMPLSPYWQIKQVNTIDGK
jgi:hypothetical protein